jgi:hypothetical protein
MRFLERTDARSKDTPESRKVQALGRVLPLPTLGGYIINTFEFKFHTSTGIGNRPASKFARLDQE